MSRTPILLILSLYCCFGLSEANLTDLLKLRANSKSVIIPFKNSHANKYIFRAEERTYHLYITFDAADENACPYCVKLKQQLTFVATAYNRTLSESKEDTPIFFISVNPKTANEIYAQFQVQALPLLGLVPAGRGEEISLQTFPLTSLESLTEPYQLVDWIAETSNVRVAIPLPLLKRPEVQYTAIGLVVLLVLYMLPILLRNYNHPMVGFALFMVVYVVVMNGTVWNAIHEPPFWGGAGKLFMPGMQSQFKVEGGIMGTMFVTAMTLWLLLTNWAPYTYRYLRWPAVLFCLTALAFVLNTIFRIFSHRKMGGGYPFYFDLPAVLA